MEIPFISVQLPAAHQGVGNALRKAYQATQDVMPADFTALLDRLDRR